MNVQELRKEVCRGGIITEEGVKLLEENLFDEEGMTLPKGNMMYEIKNEALPEKRPASFDKLFVQAIASLLLDDEESPGEIDDSEAKWLRAHIQKNGEVDKVDKALLDKLKKEAINFPRILNCKSRSAKFFEKSLYLSRYLAIFAVIGSLASAIILFYKSTVDVAEGIIGFVNESGGTEANKLMKIFVESVDHYLFAMVLVIFGIGIYELFISKIDPTEQNLDTRPSWLQIDSIDSLKSSLGNVILMVLIVAVFEHSLKMEFNNPMDLLELAAGAVLVAFALYLTHLTHKHGPAKKEKEE